MRNTTTTTWQSLKADRPNWFPIIILAFTLMMVLLLSGEALASKRYRIQDVSIEANLSADGSMQVVENRTYKFKGSYKYAYRTYALGSEINYLDFMVSENNQPFLLSDSKDPGTFSVTSNDEEIEVRWYYRARNEERTFSIGYTVENAVKRHADGAVLYYKFIGDDFRKSTGNLYIQVNPPSTVDQWQVRQWAHGPLWGHSETSGDGVVMATCEQLPKRRFFELRILYPAEIFASVVEHQGYVVNEIIAEETAWVEAANARREKNRQDAATQQSRSATGTRVLPILLLLAVGWFVRIARKYGTRPTIPAMPSSSAEVPSNLPPAMVQYLINDRTVSGAAIMGTMLDLARRGYLEFREEQELGKDFLGREKWTPAHLWVLKKEFLRNNSRDLAHFEEMLLTFVFEKLPKGRQENIDEVIIPMKAFTEDKSKVQTFYGKWSKEVQSEGERHNFFDQDSFKGRNQGMILGVALMVVSLALIPVFQVLVLIPGLGGLFLFLASLGIVHHNAEGRMQEKRWKGLKKHLTSEGYRKSDSSTVLNSIESYFVYGVVLGMQKKHMNSLGDMMPADSRFTYMPWYHHNRNGHGGGMGDSFGTSFSAAVASVNSAMSSSSGAGGGATGGGGGGAGGGGGGAG